MRPIYMGVFNLITLRAVMRTHTAHYALNAPMFEEKKDIEHCEESPLLQRLRMNEWYSNKQNFIFLSFEENNFTNT